MEESFETKLSKIDELLNSLNDENISLQDSVKLYKKGVLLLKQARDILENAKLSIKEIDEQGFGDE